MTMLKKCVSKLYHLLMNPDKYQPIPKRFIGTFLPPCPVIVEAGAHDGFDTVAFERYLPRCTVHAFEPVPDQLAIAKQRVQRYKTNNVHFYSDAVGEIPATANFHVSSGASTASRSLLEPKEHLHCNPKVLFEQKILVDVVRLDDWTVKYKIPLVDLLWLGLQGYELTAMKGAEQLIRNAIAIYTEVNLIEVYKDVPLYHDVQRGLLDRGMRVERVDFPYEDQDMCYLTEHKMEYFVYIVNTR